MSLALAELLIKQNGNSSLDRARGEHAHHGLTLKVDTDPSQILSLSDSASRLRAIPLIRQSGGRFGTFELWHRTSRELPFTGEQVTMYANGISTQTFGIVAIGNDERPPPVPKEGYSLLDCLRSIPDMISTLASYGDRSFLARGKMSTEVDIGAELNKQITIIHPDRLDLLEAAYEEFTFSPNTIDTVDITESGGSGVVITVSLPFNCGKHHSTAPFGHQVDKETIFFSPRNKTLNEFGLYYYSLYILGNYARYYPDMWMKDVDSASPLSLVASELLIHAENRVPLLALSELSQIYYTLG